MNIIDFLDSFGVNRNARKNQLYTFRAKDLFPFRIETFRKKSKMIYSLYIAKYIEKKLEKCPEITFSLEGQKIVPISYRDDFVGEYIKVKTDLQKENIIKIMQDLCETVVEQRYR